MALHFYVGLTQPCREKLANQQLQAQGFETYLPMCIVGVAKPRIATFLPGYIFIRMDFKDPNVRWNAVYSTRGMRDMIPVGTGRPQAISDWIIEEIKAREDGGLVRLPPKPVFVKGQKVRVKGSPLDAVFFENVDHRRAAVFVSLLGKPNRLVVPFSRLTAGAIAAA
jgi:transcription antitermination factor NusG